MLNDLVYLVAFMSVFFIGLGTVTLAVEKIPFLHKMTIRLINAMTFNENDTIPDDWDGTAKAGRHKHETLQKQVMGR